MTWCIHTKATKCASHICWSLEHYRSSLRSLTPHTVSEQRVNENLILILQFWFDEYFGSVSPTLHKKPRSFLISLSQTLINAPPWAVAQSDTLPKLWRAPLLLFTTVNPPVADCEECSHYSVQWSNIINTIKVHEINNVLCFSVCSTSCRDEILCKTCSTIFSYLLITIMPYNCYVSYSRVFTSLNVTIVIIH